MKRLLALAVCALASVASAEKSKFNLHLEPSLGTGLNRTEFVAGGWFKLDTTMFNLGPIAPSIEIFGVGSQNRTYLADGAAYGGGIGLRVRLLNDEKGYLIVKGKESTGNAWGNLWADAHLTFQHGGLGLGFDAALGYEFSLFDGLQLGPLVRFSLMGPNTMLFGGLSFSVGFPSEVPPDSDDDNDRIMGAADKCPTEPEDLDNFQDDDGCPEADNDEDGIEDSKDKCANDPEDKDGFEDEDGCPEKDNDKDGIEDSKDKCPLEAEDKDGYQDEDGCPDTDNDKDGIVDANDKCPNEAEDKDGYLDDDGCPEPDNDADGIEDGKDKCPLEPETLNGVDDEDGCPEKEATVYVTKEKIVITEKIFFATGKADILPKSNALLDNVATVLQKFPRVKKIRIEGHTDDVGDDKKNQVLSDKRAKSVYDALVKRNVDKARLESKGFGESKPLVNETTEAAREQNRRVEFVITEMAD